MLRRWQIAAVLLAGCSAVAPSSTRPIAEIPPGVNDWWFSASRDGTLAYADRRGSEVFVVVGSRRYGPYT